MSELFAWLDGYPWMEGKDNYDQRMIGRYEDGEKYVSTAFVNDGFRPFETAVAHPDYRAGGELIIVEAYDTEEEAVLGHEKWLEFMVSDTLPTVLKEHVNNIGSKTLRDDDENWGVWGRIIDLE